jgi:hypothetical protein
MKGRMLRSLHFKKTFIRKDVGFVAKENEGIAKCQMPQKCKGLSFARKSEDFISKENKKIGKCHRSKI